MFAPYRKVLQTPGAAAFSAAGFVMRSPIGLYPVALVMLVSLGTKHYSFAGVLVGAYVFAEGLGSPVLARATDRLGQTRVLVPASLLHVASIVVLVMLVQQHAPDWSLLLPAVVGGCCYHAVGSLVRARWSFLLRDPAQLAVAFSLESSLDELIFVVGPVVATLLAVHVDSRLPPLLGAGLVIVGAVWLRAQKATSPPVIASTGRRRSALSYPGVVLLTLAASAMGGFFSSTDLAVVAFCGQHGATGMTGVVLAGLALGSASSGLLYGSRHWQATLWKRFLIQSMVFAFMPALLLAATSPALLLLIGIVVGSGVAPTLITIFGLIEQQVAPAALTEGMSWAITGICIGYGPASALVGKISDTYGAHVAFVVPLGFAIIEAGVALVLFRRLGRGLAEPSPAPAP